MISAGWEERISLRDGTPVLLRLLRPSDAEALREGFDQLSPSSRYRRFMTAQPALSDEMVRYLTTVDGENHLAIVAGLESPDLKSERGVAVARFVRLQNEPDVAEAAVTVIDEFQGRGLGKVLLTTLVRAAIGRGIRKFRAEVLPSNTAVQALLASVGAVEVERAHDYVLYDIPIPSDDEASEPRWVALFELLRHAAESVVLAFQQGWAAGSGRSQPRE